MTRKWQYSIERDEYVSKTDRISVVELARMTLDQVCERCPALLIVWWKL